MNLDWAAIVVKVFLFCLGNGNEIINQKKKMIETKLGHQSMNFIKKIIIQSQVNGRCFVNNSVI